MVELATRLSALLNEFDTFKLDTSKQLTAVSTRSVTWTIAVGVFITLVSMAIRFLP